MADPRSKASPSLPAAVLAASAEIIEEFKKLNESPILFTEFKDPVVLRSGNTFDRKELEDWRQKNMTDPITNEEDKTDPVENIAFARILAAIRVSNFGNVDEILRCPESGEIMTDPVLTLEGITYDRSSIEKKYKDQNNKDLPVLIPNRKLRDLIEAYKKIEKRVLETEAKKAAAISPSSAPVNITPPVPLLQSLREMAEHRVATADREGQTPLALGEVANFASQVRFETSRIYEAYKVEIKQQETPERQQLRTKINEIATLQVNITARQAREGKEGERHISLEELKTLFAQIVTLSREFQAKLTEIGRQALMQPPSSFLAAQAGKAPSPEAIPITLHNFEKMFLQPIVSASDPSRGLKIEDHPGSKVTPGKHWRLYAKQAFKRNLEEMQQFLQRQGALVHVVDKGPDAYLAVYPGPFVFPMSKEKLDEFTGRVSPAAPAPFAPIGKLDPSFFKSPSRSRLTIPSAELIPFLHHLRWVANKSIPYDLKLGMNLLKQLYSFSHFADQSTEAINPRLLLIKQQIFQEAYDLKGKDQAELEFLSDAKRDFASLQNALQQNPRRPLQETAQLNLDTKEMMAGLTRFKNCADEMLKSPEKAVFKSGVNVYYYLYLFATDPICRTKDPEALKSGMELKAQIEASVMQKLDQMIRGGAPPALLDSLTTLSLHFSKEEGPQPR